MLKITVSALRTDFQ